MEAALQPFLKKLIYDPDAETFLDDPSLFVDYLYEAMLSVILGAVSGSVNVDADGHASVQTDSEYVSSIILRPQSYEYGRGRLLLAVITPR